MFLRYLSKFILSIPSPRILLMDTLISKYFRSVLSKLYLDALDYTQYLKQEELLQIQRQRLQTLISRARESTIFYNHYFATFRTIKDFSFLPAVSKEEMRKAFDNGSIINKKLDTFKIPFATSGSTGIPLSFFLDKNMSTRRLAIYRRTLSWAGKSKGDLVIRLFRRELPGVEPEGILFPCSGPEDLDAKMDQLLGLLTEKVILHGQASVLIRLAQFLEENKKKIKLRAVINASETLHVESRLYLEKVFETRVFDYYGSNEVPQIAQECEFRNGLHVNSEWVYLEIIDDNGRTVAPGKVGNMVVTFFENEIMPFIKYQTGDRGCFLENPCPCGRSLPRIYVQGRKGSSFELPNGKTGYFFELARPILKLISKIFRYQIIRKSKTKFQIKIVPLPLFRNSDLELIENEFRHYFGKEVDISLEVTDKIETAPSGKQRAFINLCPDRS